MSARERLRDIARMWDNVADACDGEPMRLVGREHAEGAAAALRALADRIDAEMALASDSVERPDGSPDQWLEAGVRISLLARLVADLSPAQKEPRHE